jgi:urease accessory protein
MKKHAILASLVTLLTPAAALAHDGHAFGFAGGVLHPLTGADHLLAMLAVGLWAGVLGGRAVWALPLAFVAALASGAVLGLSGLVLPGVEPGILASVVVLGAFAALALRLPLGVAVAGVAGFGLLHGMAHGAEVAGPFAPFAAGFIASSIGLHLAGLAFGRWALAARVLGAGAAVAGLALTFA